MKKKYIFATALGAAAGVAGYVAGKKKRKQKSLETTDVTSAERNALIVTSVASMVDQFIMPSIELLIEMGYSVDVATNFVKGSTCSDEKIQELIHRLDEMSVDCYHIDFDRKVLDVRADIKSFKQLDAVVCGLAEPINEIRHHHIKPKGDNTYCFIHSHSPIGGVVGRIEGKRHGIKNIYTAHGFHFYTGAPLKNWLIFYPIEKGLSRITDVLITINTEDYERAKRKFKAHRTVYIPGIGVDIEKFQNVEVDRDKKRADLGFDESDVMLLSVGELNVNKNHRVVVEALGLMDAEQRSQLHYFIAGKDAGQGDALVKLAEEKGVDLHLLGFRTDISELLMTADVFLLPSIREGLNVGLMEAMASDLPCIVSDIRGNRDLIKDKSGILVSAINALEWANALSDMIFNPSFVSSLSNYDEILKFISIQNLNNSFADVYLNLNP